MKPPLPHPENAPLIRALARGAHSRTALTEATGLSRNTVGSRLDSLVEQGWVSARGDTRGTRGRPSAVYRFREDAALVFTASFGWRSLAGALTTLQGRPLATASMDYDLRHGGIHDAVEAADGFLTKLLPQTGRTRADLATAVVGVPSAAANETVLAAWSGHASDLFSQRLTAPVLVENDANLMALGYHAALGRSPESMVFVRVSSGAGAGLIVAGQLHRGHRGLAGEISHMPVRRAADRRCPCGNTGCLGTVSSIDAVLTEVRQEGRDVETFDQLATMAMRGDPVCVGTLRQLGRDIGEALSNVTSTLAPPLIAVGGRLALAGDHLITGVREALYAQVIPALTAELRIERADDHQECALRGAAELAFSHLFPPLNG
ncbi:ROK family protein [Streptomyces sp. NPDC021098]|uniref:ROK family transcriptional regulator n=1 Tax=unclassified Streptomyces TaxID=2593676 RepID=UPI0037A7D379